MRLEDIKQEYEKHGRLSRRAIQALKQLLRDEDPYSAITVATDCAAFQVVPEIVTCLDSPDPMVRWNAAATLFTRFRVTSLASRCLELARNDPDELVRTVALCGIGEILPDVPDASLRKNLAETLIHTYENPEELPEFREAAYEGILAAMDVLPLDRPPANKPLDFQRDVDAHFIEAFKQTYL